MRPPVQSELDAFRQTIAAAVVIAVAVVVGWLLSPWAGVVVVVAASVLALAAYVVVGHRDHRPVLEEAEHAPHPHGAAAGVRHVLVVANETLTGTELRDRIVADGEPVEVDVLAPVLVSRLHLAVTDVDHELEEARARLDRSMAWAREQGLTARGRIGDPSATTALEDELRDFGADEVIVVTHPRDRETWQEHGELERLRAELDVPVEHVVVTAEQAPGPRG
ncbi:MAG TPA: hypothetical protein VFT50_03855 [Baekduia sp.]|nr:hypothetical protein [Baekduia sp.]